MGKAYDAIIVGARCAGAPTAMLLAPRGHRVLVVDLARFPSDAVSTHVVQPLGVAALARWGTISPSEFFASEQLGPLMTAAAQRSGGAERRAS
jgi:glycine/D-amino acid oxidase-like deaminating enzyme